MASDTGRCPGVLAHGSWVAYISKRRSNIATPGCYDNSISNTRKALCKVLIDKHWASQVALVVNNPPASAGDTRDWNSISGSGTSPQEEMATHSSILAWRIPWTEEPGGLQSVGSQRVRHWTHIHTSHSTGEETWNDLTEDTGSVSNRSRTHVLDSRLQIIESNFFST